MKRRVSSSSDARRKMDRLRALRGNAGQLHEHALSIIADEGSPELLGRALEALGDNVKDSDGPILRALYADFDQDGARRDPGGTVRVEVLRTLWHLRSREDLALASNAARKVEPSLQGNGEIIRAAGLALLGVLDPEAARFAAIETLGNRDASRFSGEPSITAARLLGNLGDTGSLLLFVLMERHASPEVRAEAIRGLGDAPIEQLERLLPELAGEGGDVILLGLADLVTALPPGAAVSNVVGQLLRSAAGDEMYGFVVSAIVASRRTELLDVLTETLPAETRRPRLAAALEALALAPQTPSVVAALTELGARLQARPEPVWNPDEDSSAGEADDED